MKFKKYGYRKTRLDERFKIINDGMYEYYIPIDCIFRTVREHIDYLALCWGYLADLRSGETNKKCGWSCECSKKYDEKRFMKLVMSK